jgi:hypothetical protein
MLTLRICRLGERMLERGDERGEEEIRRAGVVMGDYREERSEWGRRKGGGERY